MDLAVDALRSGDVGRARSLLQDRILEDPHDADVLTKLAEIAADEGQVDQARIFLRRAASAEPSLRRRIALIRLIHKFGSPAEVLGEIEALDPAIRSAASIMTMEAMASGTIGDHDRQINLYERLTRKSPDNPSLWNSLGNALKTVGRIDEAVSAVRRAIEVRPTYGAGYWSLANFKSFKFASSDIELMTRALAKKPDADDARHLHFALGKAYEDQKEFEASFRHYAAGNAIRASEGGRGIRPVTGFVNRAIEVLTPELFARNASFGCQDEGPIFVVGMHRSGSTLIEQILASHPLVEGTTELATMNLIRHRLRREAKARGKDYWQAFTELKAADFQLIGEEYLARTAPFRRTDRPYFVDKMPGNWLNLALIRFSLPKAIIIDARRHPLACGFSNFKQNYASGVTYSYDLATMGQFYRDYWRFMRHYDSIDPGVVHRLINERLIESPEPVIRRLLDHCGLPFDQACLEFHSNRRAVRTPSAEQVRRPINRDGVDSWLRYERWLGPLKQALGETLDNWEK